MPSDNEIWFTNTLGNTSGAYMLWGDFKVVNYFVTPGEDTNLRIGFETMFSAKDGTGFHFGVDRSGSADTADWWNKHISASSTTFNHGAGKLNFAIQGTLTLHVGGHWYGKDTALVWDDTFLAQGHSGLDNNWWFGIAGATQASGQTHTINAQTSDGAFGIQFQRGGAFNSDHTVWVNL